MTAPKQRHFVITIVCCAWFTLALPAPINAQQLPPAIFSDPAPDKANPAYMDAPDIISHGKRMNAVFYGASGAGRHPTVLLLHGFPGNEKNLDLAYVIRRAGWNVLIPHYRGAWGSDGTFSFTNALEDTAAAVEFLRDPRTMKKYRIDPRRIVLIGHSMGGFMAAYEASHDQDVAALGMLAAWNIGADIGRPNKEGDKLFVEESARLAGSTPQSLIADAKQNAAKWNFVDWAKLLKSRPVLIVEPDDNTRVDGKAMAYSLRKAGDKRITEVHIPTDHAFSDHRIALQVAVVSWLAKTNSQLLTGSPK
jgi:pimeloyl-ACP methyl ester carboxylesterase